MILFKVQKAIEIKVFRLIKMVVRVICRIILVNKLIFKILNRMNKLKLKNLIIKAIRIKINKLWHTKIYKIKISKINLYKKKL